MKEKPGMTSPLTLVQSSSARLTRTMLLSERARPFRFAITGGLGALVQLALLKLLLDHGWHALLANAVAFLVSAQVNFALSNLFTWRDRMAAYPLWRRWLVFHGSIAGMAGVNMLVFAAARTVLPDLAASATGICVAAIGNFFIGDRLVFRAGHPSLQESDKRDAEESAA